MTRFHLSVSQWCFSASLKRCSDPFNLLTARHYNPSGLRCQDRLTCIEHVNVCLRWQYINHMCVGKGSFLATCQYTNLPRISFIFSNLQSVLCSWYIFWIFCNLIFLSTSELFRTLDGAVCMTMMGRLIKLMCFLGGVLFVFMVT